jgi:hypothetical protein
MSPGGFFFDRLFTVLSNNSNYVLFTDPFPEAVSILFWDFLAKKQKFGGSVACWKNRPKFRLGGEKRWQRASFGTKYVNSRSLGYELSRHSNLVAIRSAYLEIEYSEVSYRLRVVWWSDDYK